MKLKKLYNIIIFILFIIIPENIILTENTDEKKKFGLIGHILYTVDEECYKEIIKFLGKDKNETGIDSNYPWIIDYMGKGLNDLGDEIECVKSLDNTSYIMVRTETNISNKNTKFLKIKNYSFGFCIPNKCKETAKKNIEIIWKFLNLLFSKNKIEKESKIEIIESYKEDNPQKENSSYNNTHILTYEKIEEFSYVNILLIIYSFYLVIKIILGIFRMVFIPKGYNKYALELLNQKQNIGSIDQEEQINLSKRRNSSMPFSEGNLFGYNPNYDFTSFLPIKLKILRFFDIFNDIMLFSKKRNRYYNDDGLEIIAFMRFFVLFLLIFSETFNTLIAIPSEDIFNDNFFNSPYIFLYRISINAFTCLIVLEGANTTYKLINYIRSRMFDYDNKNNKLKSELKLLIICIKFLFYFIPKLFIFLISYYLFYYKPENFNSIINAQLTYKYIIKKIFKNNMKCDLNPFPFESLFSKNIDDYSNYFEFAYYTLNIFFSSLFFVIITYLSFIIRKKIFDIFILLINLILFFFSSVWIIKDSNLNDNNTYSYYHFVGQKYSTKIIYSFLGFYHIGYILGFLLFYRDNDIKYKGYLNINLNIDNEKKEILNEDEEINNLDVPKKNKNDIKDYNLSYYPMPFFQNFVSWLCKINDKIRIFIIIICFLFIGLLSFVYNIIVKFNDDNQFTDIKLSIWVKLYFYYEKHFFIIFFFIITLLLNSLINKDNIIINIKFLYLISRSGFAIICQHYFLSYISLSTYFIKVKFHILIFLLISVGNFIIISLFSFIWNIVFEIPIKIVIKKSLRIKDENK